MTILDILNEINSTNSTNEKQKILSKYKDNELLKQVLYMANSKRVKFYIKQIPTYSNSGVHTELKTALDNLNKLSTRTFTGNEGLQYLYTILSNLTQDNATVIERVIGKDLKIGLATSLINKVFPDLVEKTPYMGAISFNEAKARKLFTTTATIYSDIKMDGRYCNAVIENGEVYLESRAGEITHIGEANMLKELSKFDNCVLNGELTVKNIESRMEANGIIASIVDIESKRDSRTPEETANYIKTFTSKHGNYTDLVNRITYTVWDMLALDEYASAISYLDYTTRKRKLVLELNKRQCDLVNIVESKIVGTYDEAIQHFQETVNKGMEGTIIKSGNNIWKNGKPNEQIKMKLDIDIDLKIVGFQYGTKGTKNETVISTLLLESSCGLLKTNPAGMTEDMMRYVTDNQKRLLGTIVEIRCSGLSTDSKGNYSTLHPSITKLRDDKTTCDSLQSAKQIELMAKGLK